MPNTKRYKFAVLAVLTATTVLSACGNGSSEYLGGDEPRMADAPPEQQWKDALRRPDIEVVTVRYEEALKTIRQRLSTKLQLPPWKKYADLSVSSCGDYPAVPADEVESRSVPGRSTDRIPERQWEEALKIAQEVVSLYGFDTFVAQVDRPEDHSVSASDKLGGSIMFGTKKATILSASTGCHLTAKAHKRGKPGAVK